MSRVKNERKISFKPKVTDYIPLEGTKEKIILLPEEVEAIYLMDLLDLYQEEAAVKMEISRPTFTRILKKARQKIALALLNGKALHLQTVESGIIIACCSNSIRVFDEIAPDGKYVGIFKIKNKKIVDKHFIANPVVLEKAKPTQILPDIFVKYGVNYFITSKLGEGLKSSLISKGIAIIQKDSFNLEDLKDIN